MKNVTSALMIAAGKSFNFGGVSIPLNLALTTNPKGYRISFIFGYAIERGS
jgi:predicted metallo-beta-lactamase superfamily hydrolase